MFSLEFKNKTHVAFHSEEKAFKLKDLLMGNADAFSLITDEWKKYKELKRGSNLYIIERLTAADNLVVARYDFVIMDTFVPLNNLVIVGDRKKRFVPNENGERTFTKVGMVELRHSVMAVCYDGTWARSLNKGLNLIDDNDLKNLADDFAGYLFKNMW
ncbi:hypothetical protein RC231_004731 [Salmonella enterica]|nr:hypothetical protein [Salmonella enterica]